MLFLRALLFLLFPLLGSGVEITITLDDHPMPDGALFTLEERVKHFCSALAQVNGRGAFFCVAGHCQDPARLASVRRLDEAGHFIANHSFSHRHLSAITLSEFLADLEAAEALFCSYTNFRKWYRFPYLDYGNRSHLGGSREKQASALSLLKELGYEEGFVTINTFDWYINSLLQHAIREQKRIDYAGLKEVYLALLEEWCIAYISLYRTWLPEQVTHVLLLHANDLNGLFLADILEMVEQNGWQLVSPERAFISPAWREEVLKGRRPFPDTLPALDCEEIDHALERRSVFE